MSRLTSLAGLLVALPLVLGGCSGGDDAPAAKEKTPEQVVDAALKTLDDTSGLKITLDTDDLPKGVTGISSMTGEAAHPPAFEGDLDLSVSGFGAKAEVITVDGTTYAKAGMLLPDWTEIDPGKYGAPDPTELLTPGEGFSALVDAVTDLKKGKSSRGGEGNKEILTTYTGTVPGDVASGIIPSATGDFDVTLLITDDGELREIDATGTFYADADPLTYTIGLDDYGSTPDITAP